jgi:hypothetical protein
VASASLYGCDQEVHKGKLQESRSSGYDAILPFDHVEISTEKEVVVHILKRTVIYGSLFSYLI